MLKKLMQVVVLCGLIWGFAGSSARANARTAHFLSPGCSDMGGFCVAEGDFCAHQFGHCDFNGLSECDCIPN
jgi:hypothetical protein